MAVLTPRSHPRVSAAGDTLIPRFYKKVLAAAVGAAVAGLALSAGQAKALVFNVGGQDYDVTTFTGSYNDNVSKFATSANGGVMPWFGWPLETGNLAISFAVAVGNSFGAMNLTDYPNSLGGYGVGPFFAYSVDSIHASAYPESSLTAFVLGNFQVHTYAQATLIGPTGGTASVPGPLPILGLAAAFGFSRKLRKRIKLHKGTIDISTSTGA
jgi:hypothetical protein